MGNIGEYQMVFLQIITLIFLHSMWFLLVSQYTTFIIILIPFVTYNLFSPSVLFSPFGFFIRNIIYNSLILCIQHKVVAVSLPRPFFVKQFQSRKILVVIQCAIVYHIYNNQNLLIIFHFLIIYNCRELPFCLPSCASPTNKRSNDRDARNCNIFYIDLYT